MTPPRYETHPGVFADVPDNVVELGSPDAVERAWEAYAELARRVGDDLSLLTDRPFQEELARRQDRFRRLYLMQGKD